jgi:hypothetical protein
LRDVFDDFNYTWMIVFPFHSNGTVTNPNQVVYGCCPRPEFCQLIKAYGTLHSRTFLTNHEASKHRFPPTIRFARSRKHYRSSGRHSWGYASDSSAFMSLIVFTLACRITFVFNSRIERGAAEWLPTSNQRRPQC